MSNHSDVSPASAPAALPSLCAELLANGWVQDGVPFAFRKKPFTATVRGDVLRVYLYADTLAAGRVFEVVMCDVKAIVKSKAEAYNKALEAL